MKILVTGSAGFIGFHLCKKLLKENHQVVGIDSINNYYDIRLKINRLLELGIDANEDLQNNKEYLSTRYVNKFAFLKVKLEDQKNLIKLFGYHKFNVVYNLAAQAGVRYSLENPQAYIQSNIVGFVNLLECCRNFKIEHLIYASSSSVYGNSEKIPFSVEDCVDYPLSLYAATKKSNELLAHSYSHLYKINTTGLRFFTVYGPWGRPDMAYFKFTDAMLNNKSIQIYNHGKMERDFTYVDDVVDGMNCILKKGFITNTSNKHYAIYNIGKGSPQKLMDLIKILSNKLGKKYEVEMLPMQAGDVYRTWADIEDLEKNYGYKPSTQMEEGIDKFIAWYCTYNNIKC